MTDYSAVAPPQNLAGGFDTSSAFADALQRARQIAAKINTPGSEGNAVGGTKRPHEDTNDMEWGEQNAAKKMASLNDPIGAQLAAIQQQQRLGVQGNNSVVTIEYHVPDKMVGLIIGRGGEQITRLQAESGCKIQMAADSGGLAERSCSLTGSKQAIEKAQEMISEIVNRGTTGAVDPGGPLIDGTTVVEVLIPASKVGLIIGKGGETIKNLQERAQVKMVMIQDGQYSNTSDKPLRIKGETQKAEFARQLVMDLLTERELEQNMNRGGGGRGEGGGGGGGGFNRNQSHSNDYGSGQNGTQEVEVSVPRQAVGVVIGKGGEMIKKIQQDSGARVQFQQDDGPGDRMCFLTGSSEQIQQAQAIIHELINSVLARDQQNMGRGRGRGRGGGYDDRRGGGGGRGGGNDYMGNQGGMGRGPPRGGGGGPPDWVEATYTVPANKCGIVIGKGGETIRAINQQAGAHVELSRNPPPNPSEKLFIIRGLPGQIEHAKQLINEKIGGGMSEVSNSSGAPPSGAYGMSGGPAPPQGGPGYGQSSQQQPQGPQGYTPQGWGGAYQHWQAQPTAAGAAGGAGDPNKQAADANAAAWAAYYAQYAQYNQQGGQAVATQQPAAPGQQPTAGQQPAAPAAQAGAGAQPDYSAAWADYYRTMGMYREADMIEQQARAGQQPTGQQQGAPAQVAAQSPAAANPQAQQPSTAQAAAQPNQSPAQPGQPPFSQYGQYPQYGQQGPFPYNFSAAYAQPQ